jgi:hypothetical protein
MKLHAIDIEKMIPIDDDGRMNVRFDVQFADGGDDNIFGMQITVGVALTGQSTHDDLMSSALDKLHTVLQMFGATSRSDLDAARATDFYRGFPPTA